MKKLFDFQQINKNKDDNNEIKRLYEKIFDIVSGRVSNDSDGSNSDEYQRDDILKIKLRRMNRY